MLFPPTQFCRFKNKRIKLNTVHLITNQNIIIIKRGREGGYDNDIRQLRLHLKIVPAQSQDNHAKVNTP